VLLASEQAAVATLIEEQRSGIGREAQRLDPTDHDHVVTGIVFGLDRAVQIRVDVIEDRPPLPDSPADLTESI
jgi:hypothetical protein